MTGFPVIFDATHSVQLPGGAFKINHLENLNLLALLAKASTTAGIAGIFYGNS